MKNVLKSEISDDNESYMVKYQTIKRGKLSMVKCQTVK